MSHVVSGGTSDAAMHAGLTSANGGSSAAAKAAPFIVTDATFAAEVEQREGLTIVDFWATWCAPCRMIAPILDDIALHHAGTVRVAKLDMDVNQHTVVRFNIRAAPTLLFFKDGKPVGQIVGAVPRARIEAAIAQLTA